MQFLPIFQTMTWWVLKSGMHFTQQLRIRPRSRRTSNPENIFLIVIDTLPGIMILSASSWRSSVAPLATPKSTVQTRRTFSWKLLIVIRQRNSRPAFQVRPHLHCYPVKRDSRRPKIWVIYMSLTPIPASCICYTNRGSFIPYEILSFREVDSSLLLLLA